MIYDDAYLFLLFTVCSADLVQLVFCGSFSYHVKFYKWFVQRLEFLKKSFPSNFSDLEKAWKREMKSGKMVKSLEFLFLQSYNKCFISEFFFVLVSSYSISPLRLIGNVLLRVYVLLCCACTLLENRQYLEWWTFLNMNQNYYGLFKQ